MTLKLPVENLDKRITNNLLHVSCHEAEALVQVCTLMNPLQTKLFSSVLQSEIKNKKTALQFTASLWKLLKNCFKY